MNQFKRFVPYYRYLAPHRWAFIGALLCGVLFGVSTGLGFPVMGERVIRKIFGGNTADEMPKVAKDLAIASDGTRYVTDSTNLRIYQIPPKGAPSVFLELGSSPSLTEKLRRSSEVINGIVLHPDGYLLVGETRGGQLYRIPLGNPKAFAKVTLSESVNGLDGMILEDPQHLTVISASQRRLFTIASTDGFQSAQVEAEPRLSEEKQLSGSALLLTVMLIPITMFFRSVSQFGNAYLTAYCGVKVLEGVRGELFAKLQNLHLAFFAKRNKGDLLTRLIDDCNIVKNTLIEVSNSLIKEPFTLLAAIAYISYLAMINNQIIFILFCLLTIPLCVLPIRFIGKKLTRRARQLQAEVGNVTECANENLGAIREVRAFSLQESQKLKFADAVAKSLNFQLKVVKYDKALTPAIELITGIILTFALYYMAKSRLDIPIDQVIALFLALFLSYDPIKKLGNLSNRLRRGLASLDRIEDVMNEPELVVDPLSPKALSASPKGIIAFENVHFDYGEEPVLNGINCQLDSGKTYALVGPSGAGKSTFINLVMRFYDPVQGHITLDGIDLRDLATGDLRRHISLVPQESVLFNDTVYANILLSRPEATREDVEAAAKRAFAHDFIIEMEHGYDTIVGDRGTRLSGGQRQRIAIARAFLKNSPILILDEATSALDSEGESIIQAALAELIRGKTVLIIAHRFSTLKVADEILVFDKGHLLGKGTHEFLITENSVYQNLYAKQELT